MPRETVAATQKKDKCYNVATRAREERTPLAEGHLISVGACFLSRERISPDLKPCSTLDRPGGAKWRK
ncbi:hypothetical protein EMEDMD4_360006 [Sinorhizobium medicae]|uniref:Uncharacterized protein n=1 Tax=Sinorhizobium medicae TaxID=110321 RepID=A0A508WXQ9_9HYPH|nr:hypothetical protein EMEDMD4_360006 [Sinorhizobium medicae]